MIPEAWLIQKLKDEEKKRREAEGRPRLPLPERPPIDHPDKPVIVF